MVSSASILCMAVSAIISFALPIGGYILVRRRFGTRLAPLAVGALCFFAFAMLLEPVAHSVVLPIIGNNAVLYVLYGCLAAGIFEELGRVCGFKLLARSDMARKSDNPNDHGGLGRALAYGFGHGGVEAIIMCAFVMLSNIALAAMINANGIDGILAQMPAESQELGRMQMQGLIDAPAATFLVSSFERIVAIGLHVSLSVLVWMSVSGMISRAWIAGSIAFHAIANAGAGMYQVGMIPLPAAELWALVVTVLIAALVCKLWKHVSSKASDEKRLEEASAHEADA